MKLEEIRLDYEKSIERIKADVEKSKHSDNIDLQKVFARKFAEISIPDLIKLIKDEDVRTFLEKSKKK
ncbi:hypothetical protein DSAG12_02660 [Promethearchaeum syntrophicum]|uniref:Uncharacterized protein n=1 Tax=Promethearchaeum syntrophicum TaxID=2594042 RepID=A0A5B9DDI1_9ARCH|nr:hypothetical protein [Candidatus Prometheoarchaeum syntrophicum]QEE16830.1 hypothetical protein DSAG12_02660 [Candidatus Prometheoarchaeum syntrophicum]